MHASDEYCAWIENHIESYIDDDLTGEEREAFDHHLASCDRCREEVSRATSFASELRSLPTQRCPEWIVDEAATLAGADAQEENTGWLATMRRRFAGLFTPVPNPAMALLLIVFVAVVAIVVQRERPSIPINDDKSKGIEVSPKELEMARRGAILAFAYVNKYSMPTGEIIKREGMFNRMTDTIRRSVVDPILPFPIHEQEEI